MRKILVKFGLISAKDEESGVDYKPDPSNPEYQAMWGGTGACSIRWLSSMSGIYDIESRTYGPAKAEYARMGYDCPVACLLTDHQEQCYGQWYSSQGFVKLGGWRSAHGTYNCNLWVLEPREGKTDAYNPGTEYHFYPNEEVFKHLEAARSRSKQEKKDDADDKKL